MYPTLKFRLKSTQLEVRFIDQSTSWWRKSRSKIEAKRKSHSPPLLHIGLNINEAHLSQIDYSFNRNLVRHFRYRAEHADSVKQHNEEFNKSAITSPIIILLLDYLPSAQGQHQSTVLVYLSIYWGYNLFRIVVVPATDVLRC